MWTSEIISDCEREGCGFDSHSDELIFKFLRSGNKTKRAVVFRQSVNNVTKIDRKFRTEVFNPLHPYVELVCSGKKRFTIALICHCIGGT